MAKAKHTPGPWVTFRLDGELTIMPAGRPGDIAIIEYDHPEGFEQASADAYLITAAPDLLAALKAITDCYGMGATPEQFCERVHDFMMEGRAVIAKAIGE